MDLSADLDIFFADLGTPVIVGTDMVTGLFSAPYKPLNAFNLGVESTDPQVLLKSSDVTGLEIGDGRLLTIGGVDYTVAGPPQHDGAGLAILHLTEAS